MRILFISPKNNYPSCEADVSLVPQGIAYLASALEGAEHQVWGVNPSFVCFEQPYLLYWAKLLEDGILLRRPQLVLLSGLTGNYRFIADTILLLRQLFPNLQLVLGGGIVTYDRQYIFNDLKPDYALVGDAEESLVRLVDAIENNDGLSKIDNLSYWDNGVAIHNSVKYSSTSLDNIAFPDYDVLELEKYFELISPSDFPANLFSYETPRPVPVSTGRSCPFKCTFCCHMGGQKYRQRSIANVIAEIRYLYEKYRFNILFIYDELFSVNSRRIHEFCDELEKLFADGLCFEWTCALRLDDINGEILTRLKKLNCSYVGVGIESGSDVVLDSMRKGTTAKQIADVCSLCKEKAIGLQANFIFGDQAESRKTFQESLDCFENSCKDSSVSLGYIVPFPGSQLFAQNIGTADEQKHSYYSTYYSTEQFYLPFYNLTQMDNYTYLELLVRHLPLAAPESPEVDLPYFQVQSVNLKGSRYPRAGKLVEFRVICPYCNQEYSYVHLCADSEVNHFGYCQHCHRRGITKTHVHLECDYQEGLVDVVAPVMSYKNYFVFQYDGLWHAAVGSFSPQVEPLSEGLAAETLRTLLSDATLQGNGFLFSAANIDDLKIQIETSGLLPKFSTVTHAVLTPVTVGDYCEFTIMVFGMVFFAVSKKLSSFDLHQKVKRGLGNLIEQKMVFISSNKDSLLLEIDEYYISIFGQERFAELKKEPEGILQRVLRFEILKQKLEKNSFMHIGIYGGGGHTRELLNFLLSESEVKVQFIVETDPQRPEVFGLPVVAPGDVLQFDYDALILSSDVYEEQMWDRMLLVSGLTRPVVPIYAEYSSFEGA